MDAAEELEDEDEGERRDEREGDEEEAVDIVDKMDEGAGVSDAVAVDVAPGAFDAVGAAAIGATTADDTAKTGSVANGGGCPA